MDATVLNEMLRAAIRDLATRAEHLNKEELIEHAPKRQLAVRKSLGLEPLPPKTALNAERTGVIERDGYRIEKLRYESRPGVLVTAHLYLPDRPGIHPLVVNSMARWPRKKNTSWVQSRGIGLALHGFAALMVDPPGSTDQPDHPDERGFLGRAADPLLLLGSPALGVYVWDLIRGLDLCAEHEQVDTRNVGVTGEGTGAEAAAVAYLIEHRITCAALACWGASFSSDLKLPLPEIPVVLQFGDVADALASRPSGHLLLMGDIEQAGMEEAYRKTFTRLQDTLKPFKHEGSVRLELFHSGFDYNRRMREAAYAFFMERLKFEPFRPYLTEPRPLTDGVQHPHEGGTLPPESAELRVSEAHEPSSKTLREIMLHGLEEPYPEAVDWCERLLPWGKYGSLKTNPNGTTIRLYDGGVQSPGAGAIGLPAEQIDFRSCHALGLGVPEFFAQVLHLLLPGRPEGWEPAGLSGDMFTAMVASVKTLVKSASPVEKPSRIEASGPVSSQTARHLKLLRPDLEIAISDHFSSWMDIAKAERLDLVQPLARYIEWPFK
jgi:hypothetical protein